MNKILILYYSGVGNTRKVAELIAENISEADIYSIEELPVEFSMDNYRAIAIGFPTIHGMPAKPMGIFLESIVMEKQIPAYIFTTYGLYSANALRIFGKESIGKNIIPIISKSYRCSATDGILLAPYMKKWFSDEKNLQEKIQRDTSQFLKKLETTIKKDIPLVKWYSLLNYPNKQMGQRFSFKIYLHKDRCIKCSKCIRKCPVVACEKDIEGYPVIDKENCVSCYRCIHHCPQKALSLSKRKPIGETLFDNRWSKNLK